MIYCPREASYNQKNVAAMVWFSRIGYKILSIYWILNDTLTSLSIIVLNLIIYSDIICINI